MMAIIAHETWPLSKVLEVAHNYTVFLPQVIERELIFGYVISGSNILPVVDTGGRN